MSRFTDTLDFAGGCVDSVFLTLPKILKPFAKARKVDRQTYEAQVGYYLDQGYVDDPKTFFSFPQEAPKVDAIARKDFMDGYRETITWESAYEARNPLIRSQYASYASNKTAYMLRWTHGKPNRKTLICLHGFMLGEPDQAERMFKIRKLYEMGLDVVLFIAPFHWKRAPYGPGSANMAIQPDNVATTAEFFGHTMFDLMSAFLILEDMGVGETGIIGASMGGYNAALFSCLADVHNFAAMMVPAIDFSTPIGPDSVSMPFKMDRSLREKVDKVWTFHSPLNLEPRIPEERILIIASRGDRLCPFEYVEALYQKWPGIRHAFMTGGHWLVFNGKLRGKAWYSFLNDMGFTGEAR